MGMSDARSTNSISGISNVYDLDKKIVIDLNFRPRTARFISDVSLITIHVSSISGATEPEEITIKITYDSNGDKYVLTGTASDIERGMTTTTMGTAVYKLDGIVSLPTADTIYVHAKTDNGTLTIDEVVITYDDRKK